MAKEYVTSESSPEILHRAFLHILAELPDDRNTPLDAFVAETLIAKKVVTKEQLLESIDACKASGDATTLFQTVVSRGHVGEDNAEEMLQHYRERLRQNELVEGASDLSFGEIALQKKLATPVDVWSAIEEQERKHVSGSDERLGVIMVNRGALTLSKAKDILESQGKRILRCPGCGDQYNVTSYSPDRKYVCLSCGGKLSDTGEIASVDVRGTHPQAPPFDGKIEDRFIGREIGGCVVESKIGEGGMGAVFKAHHKRLNRTVAVKIMATGLLGEVHRKRFLREARAAAQLDHPSIMIVHDVGEFEGFPYIIMQYIDGKSVGEIIDAKGKFDQAEAVRIIFEAAEALEVAHEHNIIHRDIKPDNIMLTLDGRVKVMDFGLAKRTGAEDMGVTASGVILGTPHYMSPEQFNAEVLDGRSDIYSLGVTFYHMVAGRTPFTGKTPFELRDAHMRISPPSPRTYSPEVSPRVCAIIDRMLAKDKKERYAAAAELVADIRQARAELEADKPGARAQRKGILKYVLAASVAAAIVAIVLFALVLPLFSSPLEKRAAQLYGELKPKVSARVSAKEYPLALNLLNSFPAGFAATRAGRNVESDKIDIMQQIIAHFEQMLAEINKKIAQDLAAAMQDSRALADQARRLKSVIAAMPKTGKVAEIASRAGEQVSAAELARDEIEHYDESCAKIDSLRKEGKLDEAKELLASLEPRNPQLRNQMQSLAEDIENQSSGRKARKEELRWESAEREVRSLLDAGRFEQADRVITEGKFEQSFMPQIAEQAGVLRNEISEKKRQHLAKLTEEEAKNDIKTATAFLSEWKLNEAKELLQKHAADKKFSKEINRQLLAIDRRLRYLREAGEARKLIDAGNGVGAREKLKPWLGSIDPDIARRASKLDKDAAKVLYPDMVHFEAGTYQMKDSYSARLDAFYIDKLEVTNTQYAEFLKSTRRQPPPNWDETAGPDIPVTGVTCDDAAAYARWAGKRLPTEEEWEAAASWDAKKQHARLYPWGETFEPAKCNIHTSGAAPVGSYPQDSSPCGLHDMAGNVCEWTATKVDSDQVVRGGSWADLLPEAASCGARFSLNPGTRSSRLGFRCARDAK